MPMIDVYAPTDLFPVSADRQLAGELTAAGRTWVLLTEAAEGGWGIAGTAFGKDEFATLAAKKK
jgi:phenylpyruvate tautomerase PptA (4-oxalocrotonate tautomerase family)